MPVFVVVPLEPEPRLGSRELGALRPLDWSLKDPVSVPVFAVVPLGPEPRLGSRELGALRPLDWSLKDEELPASEPVFEALDFAEPLLSAPVFEELDFSDPLLSAPISEELDFVLFEADEPLDELADSTPSDFIVAESMLPVAFMLLALWYALIAAFVFGPIRPSIGPGSCPLSFKACWTFLTFSLPPPLAALFAGALLLVVSDDDMPASEPLFVCAHPYPANSSMPLSTSAEPIENFFLMSLPLPC